jgi:type I restriction enzyme S subunit
MSTYKIVKKNQFAYGPVTSRNGDKISIALLEDYNEAIVSQAYSPFEVKNTNELSPEYLMMWFRRPEFDRYARFMSHGSAREIFGWEEMCNTLLPIPSIIKQKEIVKEYNVIQDRIALNQQLIQKLEETAQTIYKQWFVDFEFPCLPSDYRPAGQVNLPKDFNSVLTYKRVGGVPVPDGSWFVYVILCEDDSFYKGMTNDLYRRFYEHYTGIGADWTQVHKPVKVIHWEQFNTQEEAAKRENELKTGYGRTWVQRQYEKAVNGGSPARECQLRMAGEMVESELGEIPKGWEVMPLSKVASYINRGITPSYVENDGVIVINQKCVRGNSIDFSFCRRHNDKLKKIDSDRYLQHFDILVNSTGDGTLGRVGLVKEEHYQLIVDTHITIVRSSDLMLPLCLWFNISSRTEEIEKLAEGSTGQTELGRSNLGELQILIPQNSTQKQFERITASIIAHSSKIENELPELISLKDLLLSKLATVKD